VEKEVEKSGKRGGKEWKKRWKRVEKEAKIIRIIVISFCRKYFLKTQKSDLVL
jgi:hypothetical protein